MIWKEVFSEKKLVDLESTLQPGCSSTSCEFCPVFLPFSLHSPPVPFFALQLRQHYEGKLGKYDTLQSLKITFFLIYVLKIIVSLPFLRCLCAPVNNFPQLRAKKAPPVLELRPSLSLPLHTKALSLSWCTFVFHHMTQIALFFSVLFFFSTLLKGFLSFSDLFHVLENVLVSTATVSVFFFVKTLGRSACRKWGKKWWENRIFSQTV